MPVMVVVDDDEDLALAFRAAGFEAHRTGSAEECMGKLKELGAGRVDAVCMDGRTASDRGKMLVVNVKKFDSRIKILVVAERYLDETKTRVLDYGADEFVLKPVTFDTVVAKAMELIIEGGAGAESSRMH
jgi:DNA-binding response OmpR family regulator